MLTTEDTESTEAATPETDAEIVTFTSISKLKKRFECSTGKVSAGFARQLERERDEVREKYDNLATEHMLAINKLCNERDEAREQANYWKSQYELEKGLYVIELK